MHFRGHWGKWVRRDGKEVASGGVVILLLLSFVGCAVEFLLERQVVFREV